MSYTAGYTNIHEHIPFRTLTGRAHFYQDHEWFLDFGEGFCTFKPPVDLKAHERCPTACAGNKPHLTLSWITPHSKWGIHSSYQDNLRMLNLFRGGPYVWLSEDDAATIGIGTTTGSRRSTPTAPPWPVPWCRSASRVAWR